MGGGVEVVGFLFFFFFPTVIVLSILVASLGPCEEAKSTARSRPSKASLRHLQELLLTTHPLSRSLSVMTPALEP